MKQTLLTILLLLYTLPCLSEVIDGKGVICTENNSSKNSPEMSNYIAFWFVSEKTYEWFAYDALDLNKNNDKFEFITIFPSKETHYSVTEKNIFLRIKSSADGHIIDSVLLSLDRYTLSITHRVDYQIVATYQCNLFAKKTIFKENLRQISDEYRKSNSEKLKKRKL